MNTKYAPAILTVLVSCAGCSSDGGTASEKLTRPQMIGDVVSNPPAAASGGAEMTDVTTDPATTPAAQPTDTGAVIAPPTDFDTGGIVEQAGETEAAQEAKACDSQSEPTSIQGVVLSFVFDVSGSMGANDQPYHDRLLKWEPVVAATKAFFADATSEGVSATLTFFPSDQATLSSGLGGGGGGGAATPMDPAAMDPATMDPATPAPAAPGGGFGGFGGGGFAGGAVCTVDEYTTAQVPLTPLPSDAFAAAIDAITPPDDDSWRVGTPTLPALQGTIEQVQALKAADTENKNKYVIVLVTDGEPAGCNDNDVQSVADAAAAVVDEIPIYVIGVANPVTTEEPNPPDSVGMLNAIAEGAKTAPAFIVNTDDPQATTAGFLEVVKEIRESSFSCQLPIPAPPEGEAFDPSKVNVSYTNRKDINGDGMVTDNEIGLTEFVYDESCAEEFGWHYDDPAAPTVIEMCGKVCDAIKADYQNSGSLDVQFGCVHRLAMQK